MIDTSITQPANGQPRYQFSLLALVWTTVYFAVLAKVWAVLYWVRLEGQPLWVLGFLFLWTACLLAQLALAVGAWWSWRKRPDSASASRSDSPSPLDSVSPDQDALRKADKHRRNRFFRAITAWGALAWLLWAVLLATVDRGDDWLWFYVLVALHFLPVALVEAIHYTVWRAWNDDIRERSLRLAGIASLILPTVVLPLIWLGAYLAET